jgi:hypothetical protein
MSFINSDFLIMKDCKLIRFGDLDAYTSAVSTVSVCVWNRTKLAQMYGVADQDEYVLVHAAILMGNDFTEHFNNNQLGLPANYSKFRILEDLITKKLVWNPHLAPDEYSRQAVGYSLAFYQLEDCTPFYLEEYKTVNQLGRCWNDLEEGLIVPANMMHEIKQRFLPLNYRSRDTGREIFELTLKFMQFLSSLKDAHIDSNLFGLHASSIITANHIEALQKMHRAIGRMGKSVFVFSKLDYPDQKVANYYQLLLREYEKLIKEESSNNTFYLKVISSTNNHSYHV